MNGEFKTLAAADLRDNAFRLIGRDWMLIAAGTPESHNMMTASWGGLGVLWEREVCFVFVRPTRHTFGFLNRSPGFTLSFFEERHRAALEYCGSHSGRDGDKAAAAGLTPVFDGPDTVLFREARMAIVCRTLHRQDLDPAGFLDPAIEGFYPKSDYHRLFVGAIEKVLVR